ncbi:NAD(P)-dependent oxidoreductase [Mycobacteroides franklinii]|uniref:2-(Hydroxymethyl)glutarate dehydrogenase n=1 Tax=Mycobacteroides franklinii TaxID=948102 RepID=A0A4R8R6Z4_9MYCO|nr:NAD(P)-dependent oxidoreductase [Mycobacteroides franklinii]TDZ41843.1 2-(hydroxymethyl)glutarate dehydrogenase [Mycobacteroides franklinii]TDZ51991.1 2-(hydroxymethyl)glutarate dehydrogenase [Mycobacteroides franklinii]TDZ55398.1 2-(hydroxymethyl)glutarate dehydrogenase [Mycobacteroides franklinii]TDZ62339.1 2-(hydroxymethyl)glutarate dehydrogenase [Mycobacteroides franklinii]TDZ68736.1 2-(hydroxymethyl)glutarate dehydrogenase [Mycobacteroides franklinii]
MNLGFIGLGNMGAPMARRLVGWPDGLTVFDLRAEAMSPLVEAGARAADSLADVADADLISVTVLDDAQVREVVGELAPKVKPGTIIAIHSTISDSTAVQLANELASQQIHVIDAPVSGGAPGAHKGELATMVGADEQTFARIKEPFSAWASLVIHAGAPGAGTRMKLARNLLHFVAFTAAGEAQRLAESCGLDITDLGKVVRHSDAITGGPGAIMLRDTTEPVTSESFWLPIFTHVRGLGEKDLSLALALGEERSVDLPLAALARERLAASLGVPHSEGASNG